MAILTVLLGRERRFFFALFSEAINMYRSRARSVAYLCTSFVVRFSMKLFGGTSIRGRRFFLPVDLGA
jgi:hypothetical protein